MVAANERQLHTKGGNGERIGNIRPRVHKCLALKLSALRFTAQSVQFTAQSVQMRTYDKIFARVTRNLSPETPVLGLVVSILLAWPRERIHHKSC